MPFWRLYYHLVWTTKERAPLIQPELEPELYAYLVQKARELHVSVYAINGWVDHVHMVVAIPPSRTVSEVVGRLKGASSHHVTQLGLAAGFEWQPGYGALSVGERQRASAEEYVARQKDHHQRRTTNAWLEHAGEADEGPANLAESVGGQVRETPALYGFDDQPLF